MRTAVLGDIHGNYRAFRACVEDALSLGAECFVLLGDFVTDFSYPERTMDLIHSLRKQYPCYAVRGNRERYLLEHREGKTEFFPGSKTGSLLYTYERLREEDLDYFAGLPIYDGITIQGFPMEIAHAERKNDSLVFQPGEQQMLDIFRSMETKLLLTAHSHLQYIQRYADKVILNPGAAGVPMRMVGKCPYALLEISPDGVSCLFRQVRMDLEPIIREQFDSGLVREGGYWAIAILNNLLTGKNRTIAVLNRVLEQNGAFQEEVWARCAREVGLAVTMEELLTLWERQKKCRDSESEPVEWQVLF
ncbi:MAG: metallophosphoesterase family protein [Faecousia sp.]